MTDFNLLGFNALASCLTNLGSCLNWNLFRMGVRAGLKMLFCKKLGSYSKWNLNGMVAKADREIRVDQAWKISEGIFLE